MKRKEILVLLLIFVILTLMTGCVPPIIHLPPDLEVVDISCVSPEGILSFTVKNNVFGPMPNNWRMGPEVVAKISLYYAELDQDLPLGEIDLRVPAVSSSDGGIDQPGGTSTYNTDIVIEGICPPFKVTVDYYDQIEEFNEENNTILQACCACGRGVLPDLVVEGLMVRSSDSLDGIPLLFPGADLEGLIHAAVKNFGKVTAYGTEYDPSHGYIIDFVLSSDENIPDHPTAFNFGGQWYSISLTSSSRVYQEDMLIGRISSTENLLGDGEMWYVLARYLGGEVNNLPREFPDLEWVGIMPRTFYLFAIIDPLNRVEEAIEDNNVHYIPIYIDRPSNY